MLLPIFLLLSHPTHPTDLRLCENRFVFCDGDIFLDYCNCDISMSHLLWFNCSWKKCGLLNFINLFPLFLFWLWFRNTVYWVWLIWFCVSTYYSIFVHFHVNILSYPHWDWSQFYCIKLVSRRRQLKFVNRKWRCKIFKIKLKLLNGQNWMLKFFLYVIIY